MRIVTLNTWKNEGRYAHRLALMAQALGELAPDVVGPLRALHGGGLRAEAWQQLPLEDVGVA